MKVLLGKKIRNVVCLLVIVTMISAMASIEANAATLEVATEVESEELCMISRENVVTEKNTNMRTMLYNCIISVHCSSRGMDIAFSTDSVQDATTIGVKDIVIKQKVWYGWKTVATSSGGYRTNTCSYMGDILFANAIKDENYRITCIHYADADEYTEVHGELELIFTY